MIRPRTGLSAPSRSTLRYLRQLVFPGSDYGTFNKCLRAGARQTIQHGRKYISSTAATGMNSDGDAYNHGASTLRGPNEPPHRKTFDNPDLAPLQSQDEAASPKSLDRKPVNRLTRLESQEWLRQYQELIVGKNLEDARAMFFAARAGRIHESVVQRAGVRLMISYNKLQKFAEAPSIFQHMSLFPAFVGTLGFNACLESYLIRKDYLKFIRTFKHYTRMKIVHPDHKTYELFIRCLVKVGSVSEARKVMQLLEAQRKPVTTSAFAAYLAGIREKHASLTELGQDFEWIKTRKRHLSPTLYNIMIQEALAYGKPSVAKYYVDSMIADGVKPDERTFSTFLQVQASTGDWVGIHKAMRQVAEKGMKLKSRTLNSLLNTYAELYGVEGLENCFNLLSEEPSFPSTASFNIMIRAHLQTLDEAGAIYWVSRMKMAGLNPTATTFNTFLHDLRCAHVPRSLMRRVYYTVFYIDRNMVDEISRDILEKVAYPYDKEEDSSPQKVHTAGLAADSDKATREIALALQHGRIKEALNLFRDCSSYVTLSSEIIRLVSRAYILIPDEEVELPAVLPRSHDRALRIKTAITEFLIDAAKIEAEKEPVTYSSVFQLIHGAYKFMEANDMSISQNISNQVAATRINKRDPVGALHIMNEISKTRWAKKAGWDLGGLTVLTRAYSDINDIDGIRWVVDRLLETREVPDNHFLNYMRMSAKLSTLKSYREDIAEQVRRCQRHRKSLWKVIHKRAATIVDLMDNRNHEKIDDRVLIDDHEESFC